MSRNESDVGLEYEITLYTSGLVCEVDFEMGMENIRFGEFSEEDRTCMITRAAGFLGAPLLFDIDSVAKVNISGETMPEIQNKVDELARAIRRVLILSKGGSLSFLFYEYKLLKGEPSLQASSYFIGPLAGRSGQKCQVSASDIPMIKERWEQYRALKTSFDKKLKLALNRFISATERRSPEDCILDSIIALEILADIQQEQSYRLAVRCACFLEDSIEQRKEIFGLIKSCYEIRSKIVHRGEVDEKTIKKVGFNDLKQVSDKLLECARTMFSKIIFEVRCLPTPEELDAHLWSVPKMDAASQ